MYVDDIKEISSADKVIPDEIKAVAVPLKVWAGDLAKRDASSHKY